MTAIALAGGSAVVIVGITAELIAALVTGTWPTGMAHLIAALLALMIGCIVSVIVALNVLSHGVEGTVDRLSANVRAFSSSLAGAANAATAIERQRKPMADTSGSRLGIQHIRAPRASNPLSGLLAGVEYNGDRPPEQAHDLGDDLADAPRRAPEMAPMR